MKLRYAGILSVVMLSGCVSAPERIDPFAGLDIRSGQYRDLSVALVVSENTENTLKYLTKFEKVVSSPLASGMSIVDQNYLRRFVDIIQRQFRSVVKVDSASDPRASKADLIAVLDVYAKFPNHLFAKATYSVSVHFIDGTGKSVATVTGESAHSALETPGIVGATRMKWAINTVIKEASDRFEADLISSAELQVLARERVTASPAAVADRDRRPPTSLQIVSDIDTPDYASQLRPNDFALVVGIDDYSNVPSAQYAERDAKTVVAHLEAMGLPRRNIIHLSGDKAVRSGIEKYLEEWLPRNINEKSQVYFYFSGHGAPDPTSGDAYILPWDGDAGFLKTTGYPIKRLYARLGALKARHVIVALDTCFSGAGGRSIIAEGTRPLVTTVNAQQIPYGLTVFTATGDNEVTGTLKKQGHGIFTYYFLKGLSGGAADSKGRVSARDLFDYIDPRVQDEARRQNRQQKPLLRGHQNIVLR